MKILNFILLILLITSCATTINRIDANKITDLSGDWNDTDSRLVADEAVSDLLSRPWIADFELNHNKKPVLVVGIIRNLSVDHVNTNTFIADIERELINSGKVDFVAGMNFREQIRQERAEQDVFASSDTRKSMGKEIGADLILTGSIDSIIDVAGRKKAKFYQINLKLIDIETNKIRWTGQKKIKKIISASFFR